jgi:hypothetical protein
MFSVKWLERGKESNPVEFENRILTELDRVVSSSQGGGLLGIRLRHIAKPPDGFIVVDDNGNEVRRWFAPPLQIAKTSSHSSPRLFFAAHRLSF